MSEEGEQGVSRRADDESLAVFAHRLTALERRVDNGFASIDHKLDNLSFVRSDVYAAQQAHADQIHRGMQTDIATLDATLSKRIDENRRLAVWALSTIGVSLLGLIVVGIGRLAGL